MDKIAVCAIFKDEAPYLLEWLAFHKMIGIDLFVLYDNGSTDGGADLIRRSTFAPECDADRMGGTRPGQILAYQAILHATMPRVSAGQRSSTSTNLSFRSAAIRSARR